MVRVRQAIERVAPTGSRVLISGPPGSGKEVAARHDPRQVAARRRPRSSILNAAALAPERVDIELFGAEAGWQSPDQPRLVGMLERADGGTLLIDQVADMPLETQGKILRVLQEQRFARLGGDNRVEVDVRVIASSNRDLQAGDGGREVPRGPLLPAERGAAGDAGPGRAPDRHPRSGPALHARSPPGIRACRRGRSATMPWR